ncbi:MAG: thiamine pyrophosphate-dependent enzyme [Myxococcota bacterium]|jgi:2-oxoglutarate ferredoxin oxidoreductase subunit beta
MKQVFSRPKSLKNNYMHYCPGCGHSIVHRLLAEVLDEMDARGKAICVPPAGCGVLAYNYIDIDMIEAPHGRGPAIATGLKRTLPDRLVFSYQGDGDLAAIGLSESLHAANRGENFTIIFINNAVYGMTGGQMAPTTLVGQRTTTTNKGRAAITEGHPVQVSEIVASFRSVAYVERCAVNTPANVSRTKKAIRKAFDYQMQGRGFTLVEVLSGCPTNWKMNPVQACKWMTDVMMKEFKLGVMKDAPAAEAGKGGAN